MLLQVRGGDEIQIQLERTCHCPTYGASDKMRPVRSSIVQIPSEYQHDLLWSLKPIIYLMRILGIDLKVSQTQLAFRRLGLVALEISILIYSVAANCLIYMRDITKDQQRILFWSRAVHKNVAIVTNILISSALVAKHLTKWKPLWEKMKKMERFVYLADFLHQLRKIVISTSVIPVFFVLLV